MEKKTCTNVSATGSSRWHNSAWYNGLQLTERIALLHHTEKHSLPVHQGSDTTKAARRLNAWKMQKPFNHKSTLFTSRLAMDGITEEDLLSLLSESVSAEQLYHKPFSSNLDWFAILIEAFENYVTSDTPLFFSEMVEHHSLARCLHPMLPLLSRAVDNLGKHIQFLSQQYTYLPFDSQKIIQILLTHLPERLLIQASKTLVLEMHVARLQYQLEGSTSEERFIHFINQLSQSENILAFFEEYPVLARQLVLTIEYWIQYAQELLTHLCSDWLDICSTFTPESNPGLLVEILAGAGDFHREGRSVLILTFASGFKLVYKPKAMAIDRHFQALVTWLNEQGASPPLGTITIMDRGSYGWSEFVYAHGCRSKDEIARFYERQGSYLALLYALNATDFHVENVIAAGEYPIFIDLEALFHPLAGEDDPEQPYHLEKLSIDQSVFRVGLLPHRLWSNKESQGVDLSGLGGQEGQVTPITFPRWEAVGTDQMRLTRQPITIAPYQNRPKLNDADVDVLEYRDSIVAGFTHMYQLIQKHHDTIINDFLPLFTHDEVRLLLRPTARYMQLLFESFHPDFLRDALDRDRFFDYLWQEVELRPSLARVIAAERYDLLKGDLPLFTTYPDSCDLWTSKGDFIANFFAKSGLELVEQRLRQLNEQDLARQIWVIEAALITLLPDHTPMTIKHFQIKSTRSSVDQQQLVKAACAIGDRLDTLATRNSYAASWLGLNMVNEHTWSLFPTGLDLYSGTTGITLFLAYLGTITGERRYTELAQLALASVRSQVERQKKNRQLASCSVFDGLGSAIYLLTHLSILWHDSHLLQEIDELIELLSYSIEKDEQLDVIGGSAGCLLNLLSLYTVHSSPQILKLALQCGNRLLSMAQVMEKGVAWTTLKGEKPLGGFSHGTAGIALSLFKLADISGIGCYRTTALAALDYDRSLFVPDWQNWLDLRSQLSLSSTQKDDDGIPLDQPKGQHMVAWCHGAPGIGLSRLALLPYLDDIHIREEIEIALQTTLRSGFNGNHSLCHGVSGNADFILKATEMLDDARYQETLTHVKALLLDSINEHGWIPGVPMGVETPGLMTGLAGIGYELLRLARPEKVPSILLLEPPYFIQ